MKESVNYETNIKKKKMSSFQKREIEKWWNRIFLHTFYVSKLSVFNENECWEEWINIMEEEIHISITIQWNENKIVSIKELMSHNTNYILTHPFFKECVHILHKKKCDMHLLMRIAFISALYISGYYKHTNDHKDIFRSLGMAHPSTFYKIE